MPCRDYEDVPRTVVEYKDNPAQKKEIDNLAQLLCYAMGVLTGFEEKQTITNNDFNTMLEKNERLADWWLKHKTCDTKRLTNEMYTFMKKYPAWTQEAVIDYFIKRAEAAHAISDWHKNTFFVECASTARAQIDKDTPAFLKRIKAKISKADYEELVNSLK